jgi:transposase InsO family protein
MIPPSWSFAVWGLDILGPFSRAVEGYRYLYITVDKFTKWSEATPIVKINKQSAVKLIKSIICRFEVLNRIITDNGSQFTSRVFQEYREDLASKSVTRLLRIQRAMNKSRGPMLKYSRVSRHAPMTA